MSSVWVAMSGGVDSSVAAARLVGEGHRVTGVTMQLLPEGDDPGHCCSTDAIRAARRVCDLLGIDHYTLNMRDTFETEVVGPFVRGYAGGLTPNPCIVCNDRVKFAALLDRAKVHGAEMLATGHYARIVTDSGDVPWLERATDREKDQSYFLYRMSADILRATLFPLGGLTKAEVRSEARALGLPTAHRPDSQEVCFVPRDTASFVIGRAPSAGEPGPILTEEGQRLGTHSGIARYTVGQRKGLGIAGGPWYVTAVSAGENTVVVSQGSPAPVSVIELSDTVWRVGDDRAVGAVVRYRAAPVAARAGLTRAGVTLVLEQPIGRVARGQAVVCYEGDRVVGGGVVSATR